HGSPPGAIPRPPRKRSSTRRSSSSTSSVSRSSRFTIGTSRLKAERTPKHERTSTRAWTGSKNTWRGRERGFFGVPRTSSVTRATLAGHSFHHEVASAIALGGFGSIDVNRGDYQNGWDTDQFPNSVDELALAIYEILAAGGLTTGGFNFDAKLRRQSVSRTDLFHAHIAGIDTLARSLLAAADMVEHDTLAAPRTKRYADWSNELGRAILSGSMTL